MKGIIERTFEEIAFVAIDLLQRSRIGNGDIIRSNSYKISKLLMLLFNSLRPPSY